MKEGWTKKECVPHVVRTEDQGGGWYLDTLSDGSQHSYYRAETTEQKDFAGEERQAWDRYFCALFEQACQTAAHNAREATASISDVMEMTAVWADGALVERRKRFPAPVAEKVGAS